MCEGVLVPPLREALSSGDVSGLLSSGLGGARKVVVRCIWVVSAEGGGGSEARLKRERFVERRDARQRKHSPVPK